MISSVDQTQVVNNVVYNWGSWAGAFSKSKGAVDAPRADLVAQLL